MNESDPPPSAATPVRRAAQRWNVVWVVPILAILIGGWLVYRNISSKGPVARVRFETADGIAAGKTEVRCRSVRVGYVDDVELAEDLNSVLVSLQLDPEAKDLLRKGTRFWVVRPRVSASDISGLGTLLTGAYIELDPGLEKGNLEITDYTGLEIPPATGSNVPGLRLVLTAEEASSLTAGSPIYYRGFEVGRIESRNLHPEGLNVSYDAFIREEYSPLVRENTRFWNTSGIDISAGADGFKLRTPSFQAMVSGGATFGLLEGTEPGSPVEDGAKFTLFNDEDDAEKSTFNPTLRFLLMFDQSVRGLVKGAPVEFRGIRIGRVADISFNYVAASTDIRIPVLIEIDPYLLRRETADKIAEPDMEFLKEEVARGLRATLKAGNLLSGSKFVDLDYHKDSPPAMLGSAGEWTTLPTIPSGLELLEEKLPALLETADGTLAKFSTAAEVVATTVEEAQATLKEIEATAAAARKTLDDPEFRGLPADIRRTLDELEKSVASVGPEGSIQGDLLRTLDELRASLRSIKSMTNEIGDKPNSLLFGRDTSGNPVPKAPKARR